MQNDEAGVCNARLAHGSVGYVIDGLVYGGVGIEVGTELYAVALTPVTYGAFAAIAVRKVASTVECHVLQKVSQTALLWVFKY